MAYYGHDIAVTSCLGAQYTEAILGIVICDALNQAGQYLAGLMVPTSASSHTIGSIDARISRLLEAHQQRSEEYRPIGYCLSACNHPTESICGA